MVQLWLRSITSSTPLALPTNPLPTTTPHPPHPQPSQAQPRPASLIWGGVGAGYGAWQDHTASITRGIYAQSSSTRPIILGSTALPWPWSARLCREMIANKANAAAQS